MTEQWAQWENQVVNGLFPLRRSVNSSDHSAVFLTEHKGLNLPYALLKLVPAIPTLKEAQLAHWGTAAALTHPHLIRLLDTGHCRLGGLEFLFVVTEYAEQTLATLLSQRVLPPSTLRKALRPILASLSFLHGNHLVHGGLKPSNILLAHRQVKLASDTVRPSGESAASIAGVSLYDPPESTDGSFSAAGDIWSLGIVIVEALTRRRPAWPGKHSDAVVLPATLPAPFAEIVRQCLKRNPAKRPTLEEIARQIDPDWAAATTSVQVPILLPPEPVEMSRARVAAEEPDEATPELPRGVTAEGPREPNALPPLFKRRSLVPAGVTIALVLIVVWAGLRWPDSQAYSRFVDRATATADTALPQTTSARAPTPPAPAALLPPTPATALPPVEPDHSATPPPTLPSTPADDSSAPAFADNQPAVPSSFVLHEEAPEVAPGALKTIRGHIKFAVRVRVDGSGNVEHVSLASRSPSRYFKRLAFESARKWKFVAADGQESRQWLLWFDFTRHGTTIEAPPAR